MRVERKAEGTSGTRVESSRGMEWVYKNVWSGANAAGEGTDSGRMGRVTLAVAFGCPNAVEGGKRGRDAHWDARTTAWVGTRCTEGSWEDDLERARMCVGRDAA